MGQPSFDVTLKLMALLQRTLGCCVTMSCIIFASGTAGDAEEAVLSDRFTGSARERELPEREKQSARHASEGGDGGRVLLL